LSSDPSILVDLDAHDIKMRLFSKNDGVSNTISRLPIKTISLKKSPFVVHDLRVLKPEQITRLNIDLDLVHQHAETARKLTLAPNLWRDVYVRDKLESIDVDEDLYSGFLSNGDRYLLNRLRTLDGNQLAIEHPRFYDGRLNELFLRYRARNFPSTLSAEEQTHWQSFCANKLNSRLEEFWKEFDILNRGATEKQKNILMDIRLWVERH